MKNHRVLFGAFLALALLSCQKTPGIPAPPANLFDSAKKTLQTTWQAQKLEGTPQFSSREDDTQTIGLLKLYNNLDSITATEAQLSVGLPLGLATVADKKTGKSETYKIILKQAGNNRFIQTVNLATNAASSINFASNDTNTPPVPPHSPCSQTCENFFKEYDCLIRPWLQEEANRTCQDQYWATFCKQNGGCLSIHLIVRPTRLRCLIQRTDIGDLVFEVLPRTITTPAPQ